MTRGHAGPAAAPDARLDTYVRWALPRVSRTFALTIPVLRPGLREQVALSYIVCRLVDTVEDHPDLDRAGRDRRFDFLLERIAEDRPPAGAWDEFRRDWPTYPHPDYDHLIRRGEDLFAARLALPAPSREALDRALTEMIDGMRAFPAAGNLDRPVEACVDGASLDTYCHAAAGTVGHLLCRLFAGILGRDWLTEACAERGRRFGLGLQWTNVIKDHSEDRGRGISYLPSRWLREGRPGAVPTAAGLRAATSRALEHLDQAQAFVLGLPAAAADLRVFCLWAHHLALGTLRVVAEGRVPPKVTREEVTAILTAAESACRDDAELTRLHASYREAAWAALA